VQWVPGNYRG